VHFVSVVAEYFSSWYQKCPLPPRKRFIYPHQSRMHWD